MRSLSLEDTMLISKPNYFDAFRCVGGSCPDSCCKEWGVQVDDVSAAYYRSLPGDLGNRLRSVLVEEGGETVMTIENGRCPMWREDGLCRIQAELGEEALCKVCTEFPRPNGCWAYTGTVPWEAGKPSRAGIACGNLPFSYVSFLPQGRYRAG